ncbi:hypothetical protein JCM10908_000716 [Rhodotorula pacifica]|uniref:protein-S-isoprenylcysteine carboxyl O-methyltransferase n=1 Tax=Rhodotorula pacifica TaxID=1495444 RepID=UPI0031822CF0
MSSAVPPPESPFEARPPPSVIASDASSPSPASTPASGGPYSAKPIPVEFPLTSFSSTPHNVAAFAFLLGACWSLGLVLAASNAAKWFLWTPKSLEDAAVYLPQQGLWYTVTHSPQLGMYLASWAVFHTLEFVVTSMYNPGKLTVSSYLLDNGRAYPAAHLAGMLEHVLEDAFLPPQYRRWKHVGGLFLLGLAVTAFGQFLRSFAMISASSNFSHLKRPGHQLVTSGIYSWSRHPSYAGFFWWAVGTQILLGNPVCVIVFVGSLQYFFSTRLKTEERYLVQFFGKEYEDYRRRVPTRIPFVP